ITSLAPGAGVSTSLRDNSTVRSARTMEHSCNAVRGKSSDIGWLRDSATGAPAGGTAAMLACRRRRLRQIRDLAGRLGEQFIDAPHLRDSESLVNFACLPKLTGAVAALRHEAASDALQGRARQQEVERSGPALAR